MVGLFWVTGLYAQTFSRIYPTYMNNDWGTMQCYDKGIATANLNDSNGLATLLKTDANGNILWSSILKDSLALYTSLDTTSDGGFILGGEINQPLGYNFITKLNACGQIEWSHILTSGYYITLIVQMKDGGYIINIAGYTNNSDLICRLDNNGKPIWSLLFQDAEISNSHDNGAANIVLDADGNFLVTGTNNLDSAIINVFDAKISPAGKLLWIYNYKDKQLRRTYGVTSCPAKDKDFLTLFAFADISNLNSFAVLKQDSNGKEEWLKTWSDTMQGELENMVYNAPDNSYILFEAAPDIPIMGVYYNTEDSAELIKLDSNGNILKRKTYPYQDWIGELVPTYDNQFLIAGNINLPDSTIALHLWKINSELEQDSFDDSDHFVYDYKCKTAITDTVSLVGADTIVIDTNTMTIISDSTVTVRSGIAQTGPLPDSKVSVYPNPTHNTFNIKLQGDNIQQSQISLYDILGHSIASFSTNKNEFTINASDYSMHSGVYILTIRSGNAVLNAKLVVE